VLGFFMAVMVLDVLYSAYGLLLEGGLIAALAFFAGLLGAVLVWLMFSFSAHAYRYSGRPVLVINRLGILDNSRPWSSGLIRWDEMREIFLCEFYSSGPTRMLQRQFGMGIDMNNPGEFLSRRNPAGRLFAKFQMLIGGPPVVIRQNDLDLTDIKELIAQIGNSFNIRVGPYRKIGEKKG